VCGVFAATVCGGGGEKDPPSAGKSATETLPHQPACLSLYIIRRLYTLRRWHHIVTPPRRRQGKRRTDRDGTEDIYLYTGSVGLRRSLHEPTRSSDDGKSCSGRRAPDVPVAGH